ncbi:D-hexose-6-phosphate mutarotase [Shewanella sp. NFH-SH190041]|uniref:D-hexose-6-phosphate mutarotase n=1 Tax=Shewanella sp. NFH-SH190041 TaxID=2950245 RepID=UPI0021C4148D|nr:D-hexose-6-phosphate mutarotase [Shewanella sp. NFH-SH190041]BDM64986.1 D-hexose-6-phosphate mutarotase [Shewanella sp. NFH-SH190041]
MAYVTTHKHPNGLDYVDIDTPLCHARIFLQGAQIVEFQPKGQPPLLWCSTENDYQPGQGIRGGVPICWPWFGQSEQADFPQHGFARNRIWQLDSVDVDSELVRLRFSLPRSEHDNKFWPHHSSLSVEFTLGQSLKIDLINENLSDNSIKLTQALHTYLPIGDIHRLKATGFAASQYIEFGEGPVKQQEDAVSFTQETDRVYTRLSPVQQLHTPDGIICVSRQHSRSAVLWNPWIDKSKRLSCFHDEDYLTMVCLEAANVLEDRVILPAGASHTLSTEISWAD